MTHCMHTNRSNLQYQVTGKTRTISISDKRCQCSCNGRTPILRLCAAHTTTQEDAEEEDEYADTDNYTNA